MFGCNASCTVNIRVFNNGSHDLGNGPHALCKGPLALANVPPAQGNRTHH